MRWLLACGAAVAAWVVLLTQSPLPLLSAPLLLLNDPCAPLLQMDLVTPRGFALDKARLLTFNPRVPWASVSIVVVAPPSLKSRALARFVVSSRIAGYRSLAVLGRGGRKAGDGDDDHHNHNPAAATATAEDLVALHVRKLARDHSSEVVLVVLDTHTVFAQHTPQSLVQLAGTRVLFRVDAHGRLQAALGRANFLQAWLDARQWPMSAKANEWHSAGDGAPAGALFAPFASSEAYCRAYVDHVNTLQRAAAAMQRNPRQQAVADAIAHAWRGYVKYASSSDDLKPLAQAGHDWLYARATFFDSLDTLWLAGLHDDFDAALNSRWSVPYPFVNPTKSFEYSIRVVGGLLGAYMVSGHPLLLDGAERAATALLDGPFAHSHTSLPRMYNILVPRHRPVLYVVGEIWAAAREMLKEHVVNSVAGLGSYSVEFHALSKESGNDVFAQAADDIQNVLVPDSEEMTPLMPMSWNVLEAVPSSTFVSYGSGADSFFEYQLKTPLLLRGRTTAVGESQRTYYGRVVDHLPLQRPWPGVAAAFVSDKVSHLQCFWPGVIALGAHALPERSGDRELAVELLNGCTLLYGASEHVKLGAEGASFGPADNELVVEGAERTGYFLRPEYVESLYVLWQTTGEAHYREKSWAVFQELERHCRTPDGYASLSSVLSGFKQDDQPSYFIAETLKYIYLTQSPKDEVPFDSVVFTTEAHAMRIGPAICTSDDGVSPCLEVFNWQLFHLEYPPWLEGIVVGFGGLVWMACVRLCGRAGQSTPRHGKVE